MINTHTVQGSVSASLELKLQSPTQVSQSVDSLASDIAQSESPTLLSVFHLEFSFWPSISLVLFPLQIAAILYTPIPFPSFNYFSDVGDGDGLLLTSRQRGPRTLTLTSQTC